MFKCGDKFTLKNMIIDIEVNGITTMAQANTGENMYNVLLNGLPMKIAQSFLDQLIAQDTQNKKVVEKTIIKVESKVEIKEEIVPENKPKGVKKNGRK